MRKMILALAAAAAFSGSAAPLSGSELLTPAERATRCVAPATPAETDAFLKSIGLDPASEDVRVAKQAGEIPSTYLGDPISYSVASLAAEKRKQGLISFVATRAFIAKLKKSFASTPIPEKNYESSFLTGEERQLVGRKVAMSIMEKEN